MPQGALGIPLLARLRYASEQKQVEAFNRLVAAKNWLLRSLIEQRRLIEAYAVQAKRAEHLDDLREIARISVQNELAEARQSIKDAQASAEMRDLKGRIMIEQLHTQLLRAQQERARVEQEGTGSTPDARPTIATKIEALCKDIEDIEAQFASIRAKCVEDAGGEEHLSMEVRHRLDQMDMLCRRTVTDLMGGLS